MKVIYPSWKQRPIIPTLSANRELMKLNMDLFDILDIPEKGYDCKDSKRKTGTIEKCIKKKSKIIKVVIVEDEWRWSGEKVWTITHIGEIK